MTKRRYREIRERFERQLTEEREKSIELGMRVAYADIREAMQNLTPKALRRLERILEDGEDRDSIRAVAMIFDRAAGRVGVSGQSDSGPAVVINVRPGIVALNERLNGPARVDLELPASEVVEEVG